jgi:molybdate transport system permease protein
MMRDKQQRWEHDKMKRYTAPGGWRRWGPGSLAIGLALLLTLFLTVPVLALVWRALTLESTAPLDLAAITTAVSLSLATTTITVILIFILGTPLAYFLARHQFRLKGLVSTLIELPIVMPPVVAGLALLATFGRRGLIGLHLANLNITITFSVTAVILAQLFVAIPFYIRAAQSRFESLPREYEDAAAVDGADQWYTFWHITLPLSGRAMIAGLILSWARALGEFGATILFAGNLPGRTQTMPLLVYSALERDLRITFITALILLALAVFAFALTRWLTGLDNTEESSRSG